MRSFALKYSRAAEWLAFFTFATICIASIRYSFASEPVVCQIKTVVGTSLDTSLPDGGTVDVRSLDGGTSGLCTWQAAATVLMHCTNDVYMDSTTDAGKLPVATMIDQRIDYVVNRDPYIIYLGGQDKVIAVQAVEDAGVCSFMTTLRKKPY